MPSTTTDYQPMSGTIPATPPRRMMSWARARRKWLPDFIAKRVFGQPLAPTEAEWTRLQQGLRQGDPAMDTLVSWMLSAGPRTSKPLFDKALTEGIDTIANPPRPLLDFFATIDTPPDWLDRNLLEQGVLAAHLSGTASFFVLRDMALMGGYAYFNSMNQTLASSGSLRKDTSLRLGETGKWLNDVTEPLGMERFGAGFITTIKVRMVHALVRRNLASKPDWNSSDWGLPINQIDMQSTYLAFGPIALLGGRLLGVPIRKKQAKAVMHLWRYIGWLMGVDENWLALTEGDGLRKLFHTFLTHGLPDDKIRQLGTALRDEPFQRHLPELAHSPRRAKFKRWLLYQQHISNSSLILGPIQRRQLGLPMLILPWFPALTAPLRFLVTGWFQLRGGQALEGYRQRCRAQQQAQLENYFGNKKPDIIQPDAQHPAHISANP